MALKWERSTRTLTGSGTGGLRRGILHNVTGYNQIPIYYYITYIVS